MQLKMAYKTPELYSFKYSPGARHKVSAEVAGAVCAELDAEDRLTPENLIDVSRPEDAPTHEEFEWDDAVAAEKYRVTQAGALIRHVILVRNETEEEPENAVVRVADYNGMRAFSSLHEPNGKRERYVSTPKAMGDESMRQILLGNAKRELRAFVRKYEKLEEISKVIEAANEVLGE